MVSSIPVIVIAADRAHYLYRYFVLYVLCFVLCALYSVLCTLCSVFCTLCFVLCALCFVLCTLYYVLCTFCFVLCILYFVRCALKFVLCALYFVHCTLYFVLFALYCFISCEFVCLLLNSWMLFVIFCREFWPWWLADVNSIQSVQSPVPTFRTSSLLGIGHNVIYLWKNFLLKQKPK